MKWRKQYATGVKRIDEEHKTMFRTAVDLRSALDAGSGEPVYGEVLDFLTVYSKKHFDYEGRCMEEYRCPVAARNREEHVAFLASLHDYTCRYVTSGYSETDARNLVDAVDEWLDTHICRTDVHLRKCVKSKAKKNTKNKLRN